MHDLLHRSLGEFELTDLIGEGGHGQVFRARQAGLDREAVVKVLGVDLRGHATAVERFLREAKIASRLDHPYAAHVYAFGAEPDGLVWIAMELVRGTPLDRLLERGPMALDRAVPFLTRLCEVVHTAHDQGIVHRDLKPANVLVISRAGSMFPKLIDLGIALDRGQLDPRATEGPIGTPFYMAPEQWIQGAGVGPAADVYALGAIAYEVLTGKPAFDGESVLAVAVKHARMAPPPLPDGFPQDLSTAIRRALAKRAADRFASALDLAAALAEGSGVGAETVPPPKLDEAVRAEVVLRAPQPIAETIAVFDAARNPHQAEIALRRAAYTVAQYVGVIALACRTRSGAGRRSDPRSVIELLRALRRDRLETAEWWRLARELCRHFAAIPAAHPIPELVSLMFPDGEPRTDPMQRLVDILDAGSGTSGDDVRRMLADAVPALAAVLTELRFLHDYALVVPAPAPHGWMGLRPPVRTELGVTRALEVDQPLLVDTDGRPVVSLWPLVQAVAPAPNAAIELFLLDGTDRGIARQVAPPHGFERHDDAIWDWLRDRLGGIDDEEARAAAEEAAPYRGLAPFQESDAAAFLGREHEVEAVANRLVSTPLVAIVGPSGGGKSSFVRAGVIPALGRAGAIHRIVLRPGHAPVAGLAVQLGAMSGELGATAITADPDLVGERLRAHAARTGEQVVLVVDQFEELFTLCRDPEERAIYARALCAAARAAADPVRVIVTLRDDFLVRASTLPVMRERLAASLHVLATPARDDLVRILVEPARRAGYDFEDDALLDEMIDAVLDRPGALALLSFTALQLWELRDRHFRVLPRKAYDALGGVGGALGRHAEATLAAMTVEQQRLVRIAFRHLVTAEGTRAVMDEADLTAVLAASTSDSQVATLAIERLIDARVLVVSEGERGEQRVEIAHEALLDAWPRLMEWRREDAEGVRFRDHLRAAAKQWDDRGRSRGLLWRGDALLEYQLWRSRFPDPVPALDEAFARASEAEANRSRRFRRRALAALVVGMTVVSIVLWQLRQRATVAAAESRQRMLTSLVEQGRQATLEGDHAAALTYLSDAYTRGSTSESVRFLVARAHRSLATYERAIRLDAPLLAFEGRYHEAVQLSPDGAWLVAATAQDVRAWAVASGEARPPFVVRPLVPPSIGGERVAVATDGGPIVWSLADGSRRPLTAKLQDVRLAADGTRALLIEPQTGAVTLWDVDGGRAVGSLTSDAPLQVATLSPRGDRVAAITADKALRIWDAGRAEPRARVPLSSAEVGNFDAAGARVLTYEFSDACAARLWSIERMEPVVMLGHQQSILWARISPDGKRVATASRDGTVKVWDAATGQLLRDLTRHRGLVEKVEFSGDGRRLLSVGTDRTARIWDATNGTELVRIAAPDLKTAVIAHDGEHVITATPHQLTTWRVRHPDFVAGLAGHTAIPVGAAFSRDGRWIATEDRRQVVRLWDRTAGTLVRELAEFDLGDESGKFFGADMRPQRKLPAFDPSGARFVAPVGKRLAVWDTASGARVALVEAHTALVSSARFAPDGTTLITAGQDGDAIVWHGTTYERLATLHADGTPPLMYAELSPDGSLALTAGGGGVTVWDWRANRVVRRFDVNMAYSAAFSPDGRRVAAAGVDGRVVVWAVDDGRQLGTADTGARNVYAIRFITDGLLLTLTTDGFVRVWDAHALVELGRYGQGGTVGSIDRWAEVSPDGRAVAVTGADGTARLWSLELAAMSPREVAAWVRCEVPLELVNGRIVPRPRPACAPP